MSASPARVSVAASSNVDHLDRSRSPRQTGVDRLDRSGTPTSSKAMPKPPSPRQTGVDRLDRSGTLTSSKAMPKPPVKAKPRRQHSTWCLEHYRPVIGDKERPCWCEVIGLGPPRTFLGHWRCSSANVKTQDKRIVLTPPASPEPISDEDDQSWGNWTCWKPYYPSRGQGRGKTTMLAAGGGGCGKTT